MEHREYRVFSVFYAEETEWSEEGGLFADAGLGSMKREELIEILIVRGMHGKSDISRSSCSTVIPNNVWLLEKGQPLGCCGHSGEMIG